MATVIIGCHAASKASQSTVTSAPKSSKDVNYKGISFTFDTSLTPEVKADTLPPVTDGKPCDIVPEHPAFTLVGYPRPRSMPKDEPHIRVFSLKAFREAVGIASDEDRKSVVYPKNPPDWRTYFDEEVRVLQALLNKQPKFEELKSFLAKVRSAEARQFSNFPQMPFLPMWEASQAFVARPHYMRFKNGRGVFFLTQWNTETTQVTNDGLEYTFQGITDDGQYLVYAEFSATAPFLPNDSDANVEAWNEKNYLLPQKSKAYQEYVKPIVGKLQALPEDQFHPSLKLLEGLIESMQVHLN